MSQENVEIVRAFFDAWNAGDRDAVQDLHHPDVIQRPPSGWPEPGPFVGREAVMRQYDLLCEAWERDTLNPIGDFLDLGDRVLVSHVWRAVGRGPDSTAEFTGIWTVRDGKLFHQEFFHSRADALEAVGLSEQDAHADS
jgi:ketosteroid isomerase-like protein